MDSPALRVLLIEDDPDDYQLTREVLAEIPGSKIILEWESNFAAGQAALARCEHDAYLIDYRLGQGNGLDLLREALCNGCKAPIILLTGQGDRELSLQALEAGAADYLVKGNIDAVILERAIRYSLQQKRHADELEQKVAERTAELARSNAERQVLLEREQAARSEAERIGRMKDDFLATLSHELRTPLNAILGYAQVIRMTNMDKAELNESVAIIERNARVQAQLIEDLLDMNRIVSGKVRLEIQPVDLVEVIEAAIGTVQPSAAAKEIGLRRFIDPAAGPVRGDPSRIQQIVWNLLSNAIKFTPKGGQVQVTLQRVSSHVEIVVADNGHGIAPDFLPYVFDRFQQADASMTRVHGGLGLGLSIVRHLVELHGGTVQAESGGVGAGAVFTIRLPVMLIQEPEPQKERPHSLRSSAANGELHVDLSGIRVLIVDDERDGCLLVKRVLEGCQAQVETASSAEQAYSLLERQQFDVLVSDIGMPGEDGYQLIRRVRGGDGPNQQTPAVALTAFARSEDRRRALMAGFNNFLSKPVEAAELVAVVASVVGRARD